MLEKELAVCESQLIDLLDHEGKYGVVSGETLSGPFDTHEEALEEGYSQQGLTPFLVKQIHKAEPIHYFSRDLPTCRS
jgi:hypothetical protein